jgi:hypothetical protein
LDTTILERRIPVLTKWLTKIIERDGYVAPAVIGFRDDTPVLTIPIEEMPYDFDERDALALTIAYVLQSAGCNHYSFVSETCIVPRCQVRSSVERFEPGRFGLADDCKRQPLRQSSVGEAGPQAPSDAQLQ